MELTLRLFHVGSKETIEKFCSDALFLPISNHPYDNKWAGMGMYFWDNIGNSNWWLNKKGDRKANYLICKCILQVQENLILDLTDDVQWKKIEEIINFFGKDQGVKKLDELGIRLDFILSKELLDFAVVKLLGDYPTRATPAFFKYEGINLKLAHVDVSGRVIYCIKEGNSNLVVSREQIIVEDEN